MRKDDNTKFTMSTRCVGVVAVVVIVVVDVRFFQEVLLCRLLFRRDVS